MIDDLACKGSKGGVIEDVPMESRHWILKRTNRLSMHTGRDKNFQAPYQHQTKRHIDEIGARELQFEIAQLSSSKKRRRNTKTK
jgi:hypothetical protein